LKVDAILSRLMKRDDDSMVINVFTYNYTYKGRHLLCCWEKLEDCKILNCRLQQTWICTSGGFELTIICSGYWHDEHCFEIPPKLNGLSNYFEIPTKGFGTLLCQCMYMYKYICIGIRGKNISSYCNYF
jgi:hypothetical protein